jgi:hypothetical protein
VNYHGYFKKAKNKYSKTNFELFERWILFSEILSFSL